VFDTFEREMYADYIQSFSSYLTVNTGRRHKNQPVNAVRRNGAALLYSINQRNAHVLN